MSQGSDLDIGDDRDLVAALQRQDPRAARVLVERYQGCLYGLCLRMLGHRQDAEDVAQESLVRMLRSIDRFDPTRPIRPWLLRIAANRCRTWLSRRSRRPRLVEARDDQVDERSSGLDADDLASDLRTALAGLRVNYREVFVLFHEQGLSYEEIAVVLGCPVGTVKTWLHRARAELARALSPHRERSP